MDRHTGGPAPANVQIKWNFPLRSLTLVAGRAFEFSTVHKHRSGFDREASRHDSVAARRIGEARGLLVHVQGAEAERGAAEHFVSVYGMTFDDGGADGKGVHETHLNPGRQNQDGALLAYSIEAGTGRPKRTWFFFKFRNEALGPAARNPGGQ
jgi:hypothetical protein